MDLRNKVFSGIFYTISGNFFNGLLLFASTVIIARALGPIQFGAYMLLLVLANFIILFSNLGITHGLNRYIPEIYAKGQEGSISKLLFEGMKVRILTAFLGIFFLWIFKGPIVRLLHLGDYVGNFILLLISLYILVYAIDLTLETILLNAYEQKFMNFSAVLVNIFFVAAIFLAYILNIFSLKVVLGIFLIKYSIIAVIFSIKSNRIIERKKPVDEVFFRDIESKFWNFNKIMFLTFILSYIITYTSGNYFIAYFLSLQAVAFYSLAYNFSNNVFAGLLPPNLLEMLRVTIIRQYKEKGLLELQKMFRYTIKFYSFVIFPIAIGGMVLSKEIVLLLYGKEYAAAAPILSAFLLLLPIFKVLHIFSTIIYAFEKQGLVLRVSLLGVLNIILNILLIPRFGVFGAIIATSFTMGLITLILYVYSYKLAKIEFPKKSMSKCLGASLIMGITVFILNNSLDYVLLIKVPFLVITGGGVYFTTLLLLRILDKEDVEVLKKLDQPIPDKFLKFYELIEY